MSRPGFALDVERSTPPIVSWNGTRLVAEKLPAGSRVLYAPEPLTAVDETAIAQALDNPIDGAPLVERLKAGMKLTIAFDSNAIATSDVRRLILEAVLTHAATARVDDVQLVVARGLRRRLDNNELLALLGERIFDSFVPQGLLTQHDAEDPDNLVTLKNSVTVNKRVAESDLLVYLDIAAVTDTLGATITSNLAGTESIRALIAGSAQATLTEHVDTFLISASMNNARYGGPLHFLQRRENEWTQRDRVAFKVAARTLDVVPGRILQTLDRFVTTPASMTGVFAGSAEATRKAANEKAQEQVIVDATGQTDILSVGVPGASPLSVNSTMNPVIAAFTALSQYLSNNTGKPVVRAGGAVIIHHPMHATFHPVHQPSFIDFFEQVLTSDEPYTSFEDRYANDRWYTHLYRTSYAHHGLVPFHLWNTCAEAMKELGGVIVVGGEVDAVHRMGFRRASTFGDALEMARDITGVTSPTLTHFHTPPSLIARVG